MTGAPSVSVFLFCRDRVRTVRRSVESVLAQQVEGLEYIVQDGASTDGTLEVLREYGDRLRVISERDSGPAEAFWRALRRCTGTLIACCLSDEELLPGALHDGLAHMAAHPWTGALTRDALLTDVDGHVIRPIPGQPFDLRAYLRNEFAPNFATAVFRRAALSRVGVWDRPWALDCGEFELWCRLALNGRIDYLPGAVAKYAQHDDQLSRWPRNASELGIGRMRAIARLFREAGPARLGCQMSDALDATLATFDAHLSALGAPLERLRLAAGHAELAPAVRPRPADGRALVDIARGHRFAGDHASATRLLHAASKLFTVGTETQVEYATALLSDGQVDEAQRVLTDVLRREPRQADARWALGCLLEQRGLVEDAVRHWRYAGLTRDDQRHSLRLVAMLKCPSATNASLYAAHRAWARRHALSPNSVADVPMVADARGARLRVGYTCSFWDADTIRYQLVPVLRRHNRRRYEVVAYTGTPPRSWVTEAVDEVRAVGQLSDEEFLRQVRRDRIDILVELNGHSPKHRFAAMSARCAPVQVSYLNYTSTCGVPEVDYVIADPIALDPAWDAYYTERVIRLPGCFFCFAYEGADLPAVAPPPVLASGAPTFGCFGSGGKINPVIVAVWARLLLDVPGATLMVMNRELTPKDNQEALWRRFECLGVNRDRVRLRPGGDRHAVLAAYAEVDVSLDTYPYCGGNTIAESLWQGVPVVTWRGDRFSSAYGASLLTASGLTELVATSPEEYVRLAARLARSPVRLQQLRARMRHDVVAHGFSDARRFVHDLEAAYESMAAGCRKSGA